VLWRGVSRDGSAVVGQAGRHAGDPFSEPFLWTEDAGMVALGLPSANFTGPAQIGISGDGTTIAFELPFIVPEGDAPTAAFRWTREEGRVRIPDMTLAFLLSEDGAVIAGSTWIEGFGEQFATWDAKHGVRSLNELAEQLGFEAPSSLGQLFPLDMSPDGRFVILNRVTGQQFYFLDLAPTGDTNGDLRVDIVDLNNVHNNFGSTGNSVLGDTNDDGKVDVVDLNNVRNYFGQSTYGGVPEPSGLALAATAMLALSIARRKQVVE
jgi:hypothetical protein